METIDLRPREMPTAPMVPYAPEVGNGGMPDPVRAFAIEVEKRRVSGSGPATFFGWALYLSVIGDAILNARGIGSISMLFARLFTAPATTGAPTSGTGMTIAVSLLQLALLGVGTLCLRSSPWRRWLITALREPWPGQWAWDFVRARTQTFRPEGNRALRQHDSRRIATEVIIFFGWLLALLPVAISPLSAGAASASPVLVAILVGLAYGLTKLAAAIISNAVLRRERQDAATAAGLIAGCLLPVFAAVYADSPGAMLHSTSAGQMEFLLYQIGVLAIAILGIWLAQLGSITDNEILHLDLNLGPTGIYRNLPDATSGAFEPFRFALHMRTLRNVLLLSCTHPNEPRLQVHPIQQRSFDLTSGLWSLLNLSELEETAGINDIDPSGVRRHKIPITLVGHSRYFECIIEIQIATATADVRDPHQHIYIRRDRFFNFLQRFAQAPSKADEFKQVLGAIVGQHLDQAVQPAAQTLNASSGPGASFLAGLTALRGLMRTSVDNLKQALVFHVTAFRTVSGTGLRLDREEELQLHVATVFRNVAPLLEQVQKHYATFSNATASIPEAANNLQSLIQSSVNEMLQGLVGADVHREQHSNLRISGRERPPLGGRLEEAHRSDAPVGRNGAGAEVDVHLGHFIKFNVLPITIQMTTDAQTLLDEMGAMQAEALEALREAGEQLGVSVKENGDRVVQLWEGMVRRIPIRTITEISFARRTSQSGDGTTALLHSATLRLSEAGQASQEQAQRKTFRLQDLRDDGTTTVPGAALSSAERSNQGFRFTDRPADAESGSENPEAKGTLPEKTFRFQERPPEGSQDASKEGDKGRRSEDLRPSHDPNDPFRD